MTVHKARIRKVPAIGSSVPAELKGTLIAMKQAIDTLSGNGQLGAVRWADFAGGVREVVQTPGVIKVPPTIDTGVSIDPQVAEIKKLIDQALVDVQGIYRRIEVNETLARDLYDLSHENLGEVTDHADELADHADELAAHALELLDMATTLTAIEEDFYDPVTGMLAVSTLLDATVVRVDANEDSIDVLTAQVTSLESELIDTTALDPAIMWQFEDDNESWTSNVTLTDNDYFERIAAGASAYFRSPSAIAIDGRLFTRIVARIRRQSGTGWLGRASYATSGGGSHGIDTTNFYLTLATEPSLAGGGWAIVTWDMELLTAGGTDWTNSIIDQIQLELSDDGATVFDVDWIAIGRIAPSYVTSTVNALEARVTATEDAIDAMSAVITSLDTRVDDVEGDVDAQATAIDTLDTRITVAEGDISANSTAITSLALELDDAEDDIAANVTALSGLDTRLDAAEGTISLHSSALTSLDSRLDAAEGDIDGNASAITSLDARVDATEGTITTHSSQLTALETNVNDPVNGLDATSSLVATFDTRITAAEDTVDSLSFTVTGLQSEVNSLDAEVGGYSSAISTLNTRVTVVEGNVSTQASQITLLQTRGGGIGANRVNSLDYPANAGGWTGLVNADVATVNFGGRNAPAARLRTSTNMQASSSPAFNVEPNEILEVRFSVLKRQAHGYMYLGMLAYDGSGNAAGVTYIHNRVVTATADPNPYWFYAGVQQGTNTIPVDVWYDFVFYILGSEVDVAQCPTGRINNARPRGTELDPYPWIIRFVEGIKLPAGSRTATLRALNYYNNIQTDMYLNHVSVQRIDNQTTAAVESEASARTSGDVANAQAITTVSTTVSGHTASINTLASSVNGIAAQWVLQLDINGRISGVRLAGSATSTSFVILADQFSVVIPGVAQVVPFVIGTVNGVATVGINGNMVVDGTIYARHVVAEQITTPKLAENATQVTVFSNGSGGGYSGGQTPILAAATVYNDTSVYRLVRIEVYADCIHNTNVNPAGLTVRIYRNGLNVPSALVFSDTVDAPEVDNFLGSVIRAWTYSFTDVVPAGGVHEYRLEVAFPAGTGSWSMGLFGLVATLFKK